MAEENLSTIDKGTSSILTFLGIREKARFLIIFRENNVGGGSETVNAAPGKGVSGER